MSFNNKVYDVLKWIAQIFLPAVSALYFSLAKVWGLPYATEIIGTIAAIDTFLGILLGISSHCYNGEGSLVVDGIDPEEETLSIALNEPLEDILNRDRVVLKVEK